MNRPRLLAFLSSAVGSAVLLAAAFTPPPPAAAQGTPPAAAQGTPPAAPANPPAPAPAKPPVSGRPRSPGAPDRVSQIRAQYQGLYSEKCSACHNLPKPEEKNFSRAEWQRTVDRMLNKYKASDSIAPAEAAQIVVYLATFAPRTDNPGGRSSDPWGTDADDIWTEAPSATHVFNFESAVPLSGLAPLAAGEPGPAPIWKVSADGPAPDGSAVHVLYPGTARPGAGHFALLMDRADSGRDLDVKVRFRIVSGKASPSVGIVFGFASPKNYALLRYDQAHDELALLQIAEPAHTTLQHTPLILPPAGGATLASTADAPRASPGWHSLRLLVRGGQARGWLDMNKRINFALPGYAGGKVGLWAQGDTQAVFDDWLLDFYDVPAPAGAPKPDF